MWVSSLELTNIKSFVTSGVIELDKKMNVFIGPNNAGKSVIIKSLQLLQNHNAIDKGDLRFGEKAGQISINIEEVSDPFYVRIFGSNNNRIPKVHYNLSENGFQEIVTVNTQGSKHRVNPIPSTEPNNFLYTFLAKRKVVTYDQIVNKQRTEAIPGNLTFLVSRVDRISKPTYGDFQEYENAVKDVIGFSLSTMPSEGGHEIGFPLGKTGGISMERMGEGIPNLLGLITDLCGTQNKLFIIEEPENDIHPTALKALLNLIIKKSVTNQFVVTTHSNIVAKYLGSIENAKLYRVSMDFGTSGIPTSNCEMVENTPEARRSALEELGYEMTDYDLWKGWLILEESTAERLINDFFIPTYSPKLLGKLRTISSQGVEEAEAKFRDFDRLFLFTHLAHSYKNKAWVVVDSGQKEFDIVQRLKNHYAPSGWKESQFRNFSKTNLELYYPSQFSQDAHSVLLLPHGKAKQDAKLALMNRVLSWALENPKEAEVEFRQSASEIIDLLAEIEQTL